MCMLVFVFSLTGIPLTVGFSVKLKLFIVPNAHLSGEIRCTTLERLNETTLTFEPRNQDCAPSIGVDQIQEYVAAMPYHVEW